MINRFFKMSVLIVPLMGGALFGFNNCGRFEPLHSENEEIIESSSLGSESNGSVDSVELGLPYALLSAEQTLSSMMRVTNLTTMSPSLKNEYTGRYGALAAGNDLGMANGPLLLGSTSLAGEVCNSLLIQEKAITDTAARNFFGSIDFEAGVSSVTDPGFSATVRGMARSFWGRNETIEELTLIQKYKAEFIEARDPSSLTNTNSTSELMVAACAAMLSSIDAISY